MKNSKDLREEGVFEAAYSKFMKDIRGTLDDSSNLAKSMDRQDSPEITFKIAVEEDQLDIAEIILLKKKKTF